MKTNVIRMFLALSAACVTGSVLHAQSTDLVANVPFAFRVAGQAFPQGKYLVGEYGSTGIQMLKSATSGHGTFIPGAVSSLDLVHRNRLVFHCYSGTCFLAEIWPAAGRGSAVPTSKEEKDIRNSEPPREMATRTVDLRRAD